jgi:hypothetical protein
MNWVALVTCPEYPHLHAEDGLLLAALEKLGVPGRPWDWRLGLPPQQPLAYLLRTCWDYHTAPEEFLKWLQSLQPTPLLNPYELVHWNIHKSYMTELAGRGVPVLPTRVLSRGSVWDEELADELQTLWGDDELIFKPACGAGARHTRRFVQREVDVPWLNELLQQRDMLAQPYHRGVETYGERSLLYFEGQYSHAVQRAEALREGQALDRVMSLVQPTVEELAVAQQVLDNLPSSDWIYARVDLLEGPTLIEVEVIEPRLFLLEHPPAAEALAAALLRRVQGQG